MGSAQGAYGEVILSISTVHGAPHAEMKGDETSAL
jgi:hypothetical protein